MAPLVDLEKCRGLRDEVAAIKDDRIQNFVMWCLDDVAPDYFWTAPASITGKHHPGWANGEGGLVEHTRFVVFMAREMCRCFEVGGLALDQVTAAAIIHDIYKFGRKGPEVPNFVQYENHDHLMAKLVRRRMREAGIIGKLDEEGGKLGKVLTIAETHLGRWSKCPRPMKTKLQRLLHIADYVSARGEIKAVEIPGCLPEEPW